MGLEPYGINKGHLGDSWILGAAASIAENTEKAMNIIT
jgi:hypothetical protein